MAPIPFWRRVIPDLIARVLTVATIGHWNEARADAALSEVRRRVGFLNDVSVLLGRCDEAEIRRQRDLVAKMRRWVKTQPNWRDRAAYNLWLDHAACGCWMAGWELRKSRRKADALRGGPLPTPPRDLP